MAKKPKTTSAAGAGSTEAATGETRTYRVLSPLKHDGTIYRPQPDDVPVFVELTDEDAGALIASGTIGLHDAEDGFPEDNAGDTPKPEGDAPKPDGDAPKPDGDAPKE